MSKAQIGRRPITYYCYLLPRQIDQNLGLFEKVFRKEQPIFRKERESYWINKYQAIEHGANSRC